MHLCNVIGTNMRNINYALSVQMNLCTVYVTLNSLTST